jgi:hypothetical protein
MKTNRCWRYTGFGVLGIAGIFLFTFVVMWLWNWLVPDLFRGPELSYWQTLGLLVLSKIIFSGIGGRKHHHPEYSHSYPHSYKSKWRQKFEAKMNGKTEDPGEASNDNPE